MTRSNAQASAPAGRSPLITGLLSCLVVVVIGLVCSGAASAGYYFYAQRTAVGKAQPAVEYILDASPRMAQPAQNDAGTRLEVAQGVMAEIVRPADPQVTAGLRVFGTGAQATACQDTDLVVPLAVANQPQISTHLLSLKAGPNPDAAMAVAMVAAIRDLAPTGGPHTLVVVTGGADSCSSEAGQLIAAEAARAGIALQLFVVGYQAPDDQGAAIQGMVDGAGGGHSRGAGLAAGAAGGVFINTRTRAALEQVLRAIQLYIDSPVVNPLASVLATAQAANGAATSTLTPTPAPLPASDTPTPASQPAAATTVTPTKAPSITPTSTPTPAAVAPPTKTFTPVPPTLTRTPIPASPTFTPSPAPTPFLNFSADSTSLIAGECTKLHWDSGNVKSVFLNGQAVNGAGEQAVCPPTRTTYNLAADTGGGQLTRQIVIDVKPGNPPSINTMDRSTDLFYEVVGCGPISVGIFASITGADSAALFYRVTPFGGPPGGWKSRSLDFTGSNTWQHDLLNTDMPAEFGAVEYYVTATNGAGTTQGFSISGLEYSSCKP